MVVIIHKQRAEMGGRNMLTKEEDEEEDEDTYLKELLNLGNACGAADQNNLVNLALADAGIFEDRLNWIETASEQIHAEFFKSSLHMCVKMRSVPASGNEGRRMRDRKIGREKRGRRTHSREREEDEDGETGARKEEGGRSTKQAR